MATNIVGQNASVLHAVIYKYNKKEIEASPRVDKSVNIQTGLTPGQF